MHRSRNSAGALAFILLVATTTLSWAQDADDAAAPSTQSKPSTEAPGSRSGEWRQLRLDKKPEPPRQGLLERVMIWAQDHPPLPFLAVPVYGFYLRPGTQRAGAGVSLLGDYWSPEHTESRFNVFGAAARSVTGYQTYELRLGQIPHDSDERPPETTQLEDMAPFAPRLADEGAGHRSHYVFVDLRRRDLPREAFFGPGASSRLADETSFRLRDFSYELVGVFRLAGPLAADVRLGGLQPDVGQGRETGVPTIGDRFDDASAPGLARQPALLHAGAELLLDTRDERRNAHRGGAMSVAAERYLDPDHAFSFSRFTLDARHVWSLGSPQRVLALRGYTSVAHADSGNRVPFYLLDTLGGPRTLRGFADFRYRAPAVLLLSAEYRWEAIPALELAVFQDAGTVADSLSDLHLSRLRGDLGVGLRIKRSDSVLFRLDVARSTEQTRFLVSTGFSF